MLTFEHSPKIIQHDTSKILTTENSQNFINNKTKSNRIIDFLDQTINLVFFRKKINSVRF